MDAEKAQISKAGQLRFNLACITEASGPWPTRNADKFFGQADYLMKRNEVHSSVRQELVRNSFWHKMKVREAFFDRSGLHQSLTPLSGFRGKCQ